MLRPRFTMAKLEHREQAWRGDAIRIAGKSQLKKAKQKPRRARANSSALACACTSGPTAGVQGFEVCEDFVKAFLELCWIC